MKGLVLLVIAAALLAAAAWFIHQRDAASWRDKALPAGAEMFPGLPVNDIAEVRLQSADRVVTLRKGDSGWQVAERGGYPADFGKVSGLVRKLAGLAAVQTVPVGVGDVGALALRAPGDGVPAGEAGTVVVLRDRAGAELASVVLGKTHFTTPPGVNPAIGGEPTGRYVLATRDPRNAYLVGEAFADAGASPADWVAKDFVRPGPVRRIEVRSAAPGRSWILERPQPGAPWGLADARKGESLDNTKVLSLDSLLSGISVADAPAGPDDPRLQPLADKPLVVVCETFDGLRHTLTFGEGDGDNLPVRVVVEALPDSGAAPAGGDPAAAAREETLREAARFKDRAVFVPRNFLQPFLTPRSDLLAAPPAAVPGPTPPPGKKKKQG